MGTDPHNTAEQILYLAAASETVASSAKPGKHSDPTIRLLRNLRAAGKTTPTPTDVFSKLYRSDAVFNSSVFTEPTGHL